MNREATRLKVCGIRFQWSAAYRRLPGHWEYEEINDRCTHGLTITLLDALNGCVAEVSLWSIGDSARIRKASVTTRAKSRKAALIEAVDLLDYPLRVCGFQKLGAKS